MNDRTMSAPAMKRAFNEWMRRYTEEPETFAAEFKTVGTFLAEQAEGREPSYGEVCTAYQFKILDELNAA